MTLTPEQRELWEEIGVPDPQPEREQTPEQAVNLGIRSFQDVCRLEGVEPPSEEAIRAEMDEGGRRGEPSARRVAGGSRS